MEVLFLVIGLAVGAVIGFLVAKSRQGGSDINDSINSLRIENGTLIAANANLIEDTGVMKEELSKLREELKTESVSAAEWKSKHEHLSEKLVEQKQELDNLQKKFMQEFELVASKILDDKSSKFTEQNQKNLDTLLTPLKERIGEFQKKVEDVNEKNAERSSALKDQLEMLRKLNADITQETRSLTQALRGDSKTQGNWGEMQLEMILDKAGLQKEVHYTKETNVKSDDGNNQRLDYIVNMPDGKHLIIDSKVSLTAYSKYFDTEDENERKQLLRQHLDSILGHIKLLGNKDYQKLHNTAPDYVLMFIANEPALTMALKEDPTLFEKALDKNIVLVSTSTLLATLRTISYIWKQDLQSKNAEEIARQAANLYDKFVGFSDDLIKLGDQMGTAAKTYESAMNKLVSGSGNLTNRVEKLKKLGVNPSKNIDQRLIDRAEDE